MSLKICLLCERLGAHAANEGFTTIMYVHVSLQVHFLREPSQTNMALVWLLTTMDDQVRRKIRPMLELFPADVTFEGTRSVDVNQ
jgi:hypothetical protein